MAEQGRYWIEDESSGKRYPLDGISVTIGRDDSCQIRLTHASISRRHATLVRVGTEWSIEDEGSRNGTEVEGKKVDHGASRVVSLGKRFSLGSVHFILREASEADEKDIQEAAEFSLEHFLPDHPTANDAGPFASLTVDLLYRAQQMLFPGQGSEQLLESLLHLVLASVPASRASLHLYDEKEGLKVKLTFNKHGESLFDQKDFLISKGLAKKVSSKRKAVLIRDVNTDREFRGRESLVSAGVASAVAAPMFDGNDLLGILYADSPADEPPLAEIDVATLTIIASVAGAAIVAANLVTGMLRTEVELRHEIDELRRQLAATNHPR